MTAAAGTGAMGGRVAVITGVTLPIDGGLLAGMAPYSRTETKE